jgi:hypothetical protein
MTLSPRWVQQWERLLLWRQERGRWVALQVHRVSVLGRKVWRELITVILGLLGWGVLTHVLVRWLGPVVWEISLGLLCLSLFGWQFAFVIARDGLYALGKRGTKGGAKA